MQPEASIGHGAAGHYKCLVAPPDRYKAAHLHAWKGEIEIDFKCLLVWMRVKREPLGRSL